MNNQHLKAASHDVLVQGLALVSGLDAATYCRKLPQAFNASIGGHYRHCLDHFECLLGTIDGTVDYDARERDPGVETDPAIAAARTAVLMDRIEAITASQLDADVRVRCKVSYHGEASPLVASTFARETMYAIVHAVHHYALIGVMSELLGHAVPEGFGIAPSTARHRLTAVAG